MWSTAPSARRRRARRSGLGREHPGDEFVDKRFDLLGVDVDADLAGLGEAGAEELFDLPGVDAFHEGVLLASGLVDEVDQCAIVLVSLFQPVPELVPLHRTAAAVDLVEVDHLWTPCRGAFAAAGAVVLEVDPVAGVGAVLEFYAAGVQVGASDADSSFDALEGRSCLRVGGLAGVVEEPAGDEAAVAFQDDILAVFLDDRPGLGGVESVLGDASGQADDFGTKLLQQSAHGLNLGVYGGAAEAGVS